MFGLTSLNLLLTSFKTVVDLILFKHNCFTEKFLLPIIRLLFSCLVGWWICVWHVWRYDILSVQKIIQAFMQLIQLLFNVLECGIIFRMIAHLWRRQWHPTPVICLENPMDGGAWWAAVHGVAKSRTRLSDFTFTFHFHALEKEMATHSSVLAWRIAGMGEPGGCCLWGRTESDTTKVT